MKVLEPVERYFEAWNSHDGGAIAACFDRAEDISIQSQASYPRPASARTRRACSAPFPICALNCMSPQLTNRTSLRNGP